MLVSSERILYFLQPKATSRSKVEWNKMDSLIGHFTRTRHTHVKDLSDVSINLASKKIVLSTKILKNIQMNDITFKVY
jgi:hypothetical protein